MDPFIIDHLQRHNIYTDEPDTLYPILNDPHFDQPPPLERSERDDIEAFITELDLAESKILDAIRVLKEKQEEIRRSRDYHRAVISPIRRVPDELLAKIFLHSLPATTPGGDGPLVCPFNRNFTPWRLTYVCRRWRSIAIALPALWSHGVLDIFISEGRGHPSNKINQHGARELTKLYLERSHPLLINFNLRCERSATPPPPPRELGSGFTPNLTQELLQHSTRFNRLSLIFLGSYAAVDSPGITAPQLPRLTSMVYHNEATRAPQWLIDAMKTAPALRALSTNTISFFPPLILPALSATLRKITHLILGSAQNAASPHVALLLIDAMPCLIDCDLHVDASRNEQQSFIDHPLDPAPDLVKLTRLTNFRLDSRYPVFVSLISKLELPSLQRLNIRTPDSPISNVIFQLIQRSSCNITSLTLLIYPHVDAEDLLGLLRNSPNLQSLTVCKSHPSPVYDQLLTGLVSERDTSGTIQQSPICAGLQALTLLSSSCHYMNFSHMAILVEFVRSRSQSPEAASTLRSVEVIIECPLTPNYDAIFAVPSFSPSMMNDLWEACRPASCEPSVKIHGVSGGFIRRKQRYDFQNRSGWILY